MSASKIESTTNYNRFKFMDGNRPINTARVRKLMRSIKRKNMLQQFPIVCQKNGSGLYIMDGQHRFSAAKELELPISFVEAKNVKIADVAATNSVQKAWKPSDFVSSYAALGYADYVTLRDFVAQHGLPITTSASILSGILGNDLNNKSNTLNTGGFKVADLAFANRVAAAINSIAKLFPPAKERGFVIALARLLRLKQFSITRLMQKLEHQSSKLVKCATWIQYVELIEDIYNWKSTAENIQALAIEVKRTLARGSNRVAQ